MHWLKHPAAAYVAPFVTFMVLLVAGPKLPFGPWEQPLRVVLLTLTLLVFSRGVIDWRPARPLASIVLGLAVFAVWVAPDLVSSGYREHWLFQNAVMGTIDSSLPAEYRTNLVVLVSRTVRAVVLVPVIEELFWRGWLMRWLINTDFKRVPLGTYSALSFWVTALLFASEHGPYWEVGLLAGIAYNWWMMRTRRLSDCILAHAVTNGVLSAFVILTGRWQYWM